MRVCDVCNTVDKAGLASKKNDEIVKTLDRMAKGKFSLTEKFEMAVAGVNKADMQQLAAGAQQIVSNDFRGDAKAALAFLNGVRNTGLAQLDFTQIVASGDAHRLIALERSDPAAFRRVCNGHYNDVASLGKALGGPSAGVPGQPQSLGRGAQLSVPRALS